MFMEYRRFFHIILVVVFCLSLALVPGKAYSASVGQALNNVEIRDSNNNPQSIPDFGKKVLTIFYVDPDAKDVTDPIADALKARKFPKDKYKGIGITNLKDTWKPNAIIRMVIRSKEKKYNTKILTDVDRSLAKNWGLGNCDDVAVVLVIGKDQKIKFIKKVGTAAEAGSLASTVVKLVEDEIGK
jgi:predicted transcriptional regulator